MKCLKVSLRLLNSSTKLLHNISLPLNSCMIWNVCTFFGLFCGFFFSFPLTLPSRLCSSVSSLMNIKRAFLLAFFFWLWFCLVFWVFLGFLFGWFFGFFYTRHGFKNWNIRHLDLLKSTVLGEGSIFLRALHFHLCIAELSLKCTRGVEHTPFCYQGQTVCLCLNKPPWSSHFPFSLFLLRIGLLINLLGGCLCSIGLFKVLSKRSWKRPSSWHHQFYREINWGMQRSVGLVEAGQASMADCDWRR